MGAGAWGGGGGEQGVAVGLQDSEACVNLFRNEYTFFFPSPPFLLLLRGEKKGGRIMNGFLNMGDTFNFCDGGRNRIHLPGSGK